MTRNERAALIERMTGEGASVPEIAEAIGIRPQSVYETALRFGVRLENDHWAWARMLRLPPVVNERFGREGGAAAHITNQS